MRKYLPAIALLVSVVALGVALLSGGDVVRNVTEKAVGGSSPVKTSHQFFLSGATFGGRTATTSDVATYTTEDTDFNNEPTVIDWTPNVNTTVSISATSTHGYVPNVGDVATTYWRNASSTAAATMTFAAQDAGVDIQHADGGDLVLNGLDWAKVTFVRESQNLVTVMVDEMTEGD